MSGPRTCPVCEHPKREAIYQAVLAGEPRRNVARRYRVSLEALDFHLYDIGDWHLSEPERDALILADATREGPLPDFLDVSSLPFDDDLAVLRRMGAFDDENFPDED